jgi:hypothetical protein
MDSDNKFWLGIWIVIAVAVVMVVGIVSNHFQKTNEQIRTAATCEAAVMLDGGHNTELRLMVCAMGRELKKVPQ